MATTFLLIRHAAHDWLGKGLAGRAPGVLLNAKGHSEAQGLPARLSGAGITAVYVSPRVRTRDTAAPLALHLGLTPAQEDGIDEIDFGDWTGKSFAQLSADPGWRVWVERRSLAEPPNGEPLHAAQKRVVEAIRRLRARHEGETVALVSHGDVIKAALAFYLGLSLDNLERFEIAPVSVSVLTTGAGWAQVRLINGCGELPRACIVDT